MKFQFRNPITILQWNHIIKILKFEFVGGPSTLNFASCQFLGGEGGGSIDTQLWKLSILRWGGRGGEGRGDQSTLNLERIHRDFGRITSDNVHPGGVNQHSTWKGSAETLEGSPLTMFILGGGSIDTQLGKDLQRLWKDRL